MAAGGYSTSVLKDLFCVPRPFSPPLVRLSTGKHGIEYGFPSTHSTTSVSMCLFLCDLFVDSQITRAALVFLAGSVVFGRAYTGMHSMVDIGVGSFIGWAVYALFRALELEIEFFTVTQGWLGQFAPPAIKSLLTPSSVSARCRRPYNALPCLRSSR